MRNVLFWLGFALAIFLPTAIQAKESNHAPHFKINHQAFTGHEYKSLCDNIQVFDLLEDEIDDNDSESERKKTSPGKSEELIGTLYSDRISDTFFKKELSPGYSVNHRASLHIFLGVFRL